MKKKKPGHSKYRQIQDDMRGKLLLHCYKVMPLTEYWTMIIDVRDVYHNMNFSLEIRKTFIFG